VIALGTGLVLLAAIGWGAAGAGAPPGESRATRVVRGAVWAFAALVVALQALGASGLLRPPAAIGALAILAAAAITARRAWPPAAGTPGTREPWTPPACALAACAGGALAQRLWAGLHKTAFLYDALSYHLHAPATWMHAGRLEVVPAVFGDPAPAYAPANLQLVFWFLMAPLRSDYLGGAGQWPFAVLAVMAVAATVREVGGGRATALAAGLAFLTLPEVWTQAEAAMADLGLAAAFLATLVFVVRAVRRPTARDLAAVGLGAGLVAGTKAIGLVFAAPLLAAAAAAIVVGRRGAGAIGRGGAIVAGAALAGGGFWPARNLLLTGNPVYPLAVRVGGRILLPGVYDAAAMRAWEYHVPVGDVGALGRMLLDGGGGFALGAALAFARARRPPWVLAALLLIALFWLVIPYQESRFLFPAFGVAAVAMGHAAAIDGPRRGWVPLALALGGSSLGLSTGVALILVGAAALGPLVGPMLGRCGRLARAALLAGAALAGLALGAAGLARYRASDPGYAVGDGLDDAWRWFRAHVHGARVAYTGVNLAFPLAGVDLANEVRYVNVAGAAGDLLHEFPPGPGDHGAEAAPYRAGARYETWAANLRAARAEVLFVAALYPIVRRTIASDAAGFPVERTWADAHPAQFHLRYASEAARVYAVELGP